MDITVVHILAADQLEQILRTVRMSVLLFGAFYMLGSLLRRSS